MGEVAERVRWILSWTDLRSLLIFLGFWRLGKVAERVRWILPWTELFPCHTNTKVGEGVGEGQVDPVLD